MLFKLSHDVPITATEDNPDWQKLQLSKGEIIQWLLLLPVETSNLLKLKVEYHGVQVLPFSPQEAMYGGGYMFDVEESILVDTPPYELDIYAWNTDTVRAHEYNLMVNVRPKKPVEVTEGIEGLWERLKGWVGGE